MLLWYESQYGWGSMNERYLAKTELCDWEDPEILKLADELKAKSRSQKEYAVNAFYWVRDNIYYGGRTWKASEGLKQRKGNCWSKANLLEGLCRANEIPARFEIQIIGGDAISDIAPHFASIDSKFISKIQRNAFKIPHASASIYLDGEWIRADCTRDEYLAQTYDWDGYNPTPKHPKLIKYYGYADDLGVFYEKQNRKMERMKKRFSKLFKLMDCGQWMIDIDEMLMKQGSKILEKRLYPLRKQKRFSIR